MEIEINKKSKENIKKIKEFLRLKDDSRPAEEISTQELSSFISEFIITVRKKDNNEDYEPKKDTRILIWSKSVCRYLLSVEEQWADATLFASERLKSETSSVSKLVTSEAFVARLGLSDSKEVSSKGC